MGMGACVFAAPDEVLTKDNAVDDFVQMHETAFSIQ
jgi:hypothetical protein